MINLTIKRNELLALHSCIRIILDNEMASPADAGLLMETMSHLAKQDKETKKEFTLKLESKMLKPLWHSCKITLDNNLHKDHHHATDIMVIIGKIAEEIDKEIAMGSSPQLVLI